MKEGANRAPWGRWRPPTRAAGISAAVDADSLPLKALSLRGHRMNILEAQTSLQEVHEAAQEDAGLMCKRQIPLRIPQTRSKNHVPLDLDDNCRPVGPCILAQPPPAASSTGAEARLRVLAMNSRIPAMPEVTVSPNRCRRSLPPPPTQDIVPGQLSMAEMVKRFRSGPARPRSERLLASFLEPQIPPSHVAATEDTSPATRDDVALRASLQLGRSARCEHVRPSMSSHDFVDDGSPETQPPMHDLTAQRSDSSQEQGDERCTADVLERYRLRRRNHITESRDCRLLSASVKAIDDATGIVLGRTEPPKGTPVSFSSDCPGPQVLKDALQSWRDQRNEVCGACLDQHVTF